MKTRVVHCKRDHYDVYIGRPSIWGNPFTVGISGTRPEILEKYEQHARTNAQIQEHLMELDGKVLGCWCRPERCHGDILVKLIEERKYA